MTDPVRAVDSEVIGLLREVADASDSRLFRRVLREPVVSPLAASLDPFPGRAAAEVHLLRHHREAVRDLLEALFRRKAELDPRAGSLALNRSPSPAPPSGVGARLERHAEAGRVADPLRRLFRIGDDTGLRDVSFAHLTKAMTAILPGDRAQVFASLAALFENRLDACIASARGVAEGPGVRDLRGNAWANLATARSQAGHARAACVAFSRAGSLCPENVRYVGSALITALDAGEDAAAILAARHLEDLVASDRTALAAFARAHRSRIDAGTYRLESSWRDAFLRIEDGVGPLTARTLHELADL